MAPTGTTAGRRGGRRCCVSLLPLGWLASAGVGVRRGPPGAVPRALGARWKCSGRGGGVGDEGKVRVQRRKGGGKSRAQGGLSARFWGPWVQLQAEDPDSSPGHTGLGRPDGGGAGGRALWPASVTHPWEPCAGTEMHGEQAEASPAPRPPPVRAGLTLMRQQKRPRSDGGAGRGRRGQPSERPSDNGLLTETTGTGNVQPLL